MIRFGPTMDNSSNTLNDPYITLLNVLTGSSVKVCVRNVNIIVFCASVPSVDLRHRVEHSIVTQLLVIFGLYSIVPPIFYICANFYFPGNSNNVSS